jgi:hypothetical protein
LHAITGKNTYNSLKTKKKNGKNIVLIYVLFNLPPVNSDDNNYISDDNNYNSDDNNCISDDNNHISDDNNCISDNTN